MQVCSYIAAIHNYSDSGADVLFRIYCIAAVVAAAVHGL